MSRAAVAPFGLEQARQMRGKSPSTGAGMVPAATVNGTKGS